MQLLTELIRNLTLAPVTVLEAEEYSSSLFPELLWPSTLRLITTRDFINFGHGALCQALDIPTIHRTSDEDFNDIFDKFGPKGPTWFEIEDIKPTHHWSIHHKAFKADTLPGAAFFYRGKNQTGMAVWRELSGFVRAHPCGPADEQYRWVMQNLVSALFAIEEMPPIVSKTMKASFSIPPILRDQAPKPNAFFSRVYLRREISEKILALPKHQKTLDISGRRFHFVRGHWMTPHNKTKRSWRRFHWRGDASIGIVRRVYIAK